MTVKAKRNALILLCLVMVITLIMAASLPSLEFEPGMPLPHIDDSLIILQDSGSAVVESVPVNQFMLIQFIALFVFFMVYMQLNLLRGIDWRSIFSHLRVILVVGLLLMLAMFIILLLPGKMEKSEVMLPLPTPAPLVTGPLGPVPPLLLWLVGLILLVAGTFIVLWIIRAGSEKPATIDLLGLEAEKARQDIQIGVGLKDVIMRCYRKMSLVMKNDEGINRPDFMTTGEFEALLTEAGLPRAPIQQLTRLFEAARYGNWLPDQRDEEIAIHCLEAIIEYSRNTKTAKE